jgi:predicted aconitase
MILTKEEERMLEGRLGYGVQKSMELLVSLGEIYGAKKMVEISSAHLPGVGVESAGKWGKAFVEEMYKGGARFRAWATLNTCSIDFVKWKQIGISEEIVHNQIELSEFFRKMGSMIHHTCTPYLGFNIPRVNEHIAWGDSSALLFANSVFGARTNREGGPSALAAAVTGRVPLYGLHLDKNRRGDCLIDVRAKLRDRADFSALGYLAGRLLKKGNPVFSNLSPRVGFQELKALCSLSAPSSIGLFHVIGVTPEARTAKEVFPNGEPEKRIVIHDGDIEKTVEELNTAEASDIGLVVVGCSHASLLEITQISQLLEGKRIKSGSKLWIFTSSAIKSVADRIGCTNIIERAGGLILCDCCPNLLPDDLYRDQNIRCVTTNSAMILHYLSVYHGTLNLQSHFGSAEKCIKSAICGKWQEA